MAINIEPTILQELEKEVREIISTYLLHSSITELEKREVINKASYASYEDLLAFANKDPASLKSPYYVLHSYLSFKAVLHYRVANALHKLSQGANEITYEYLQIVARTISEKAKAETGIEIHPASKIGHRFIIDHGYGTVIGETSEIGNDCYLLQGVILGARSIAGNQRIKRHPTLKDGIEVGSFVRIFGPVTVGSNVVISPNAVITQDIPANTQVVVLTVNQFLKNSTYIRSSC
jgi:serine O-acetyltransferase